MHLSSTIVDQTKVSQNDCRAVAPITTRHERISYFYKSHYIKVKMRLSPRVAHTCRYVIKGFCLVWVLVISPQHFGRACACHVETSVSHRGQICFTSFNIQVSSVLERHPHVSCAACSQ